MKKKLLKTTFTEKLEEVTKFFLIFQKTYKSKEKFPSDNRVSRCSQNNRQVLIGKETAKSRTKNEKLQKIKRKSSNFRHFFVIILNKKMILTHKNVTNCYHNIAQVEGLSSIPI